MLIWLKDYNVKRLHEVRQVRPQTEEDDAVLVYELDKLAKAVTAVIIAYKKPIF